VLPGWSKNGNQILLAPAGTPRAVRAKLHKEATRILDLPEVKQRLESHDFTITPTTLDEGDKNLRADIEVFTRIAKDAGLRPR
jgi:tripartite-type tricarboxylate transporter receptor subunit TctC